MRAAALDTPLGRLRITLNALDIPEAEDPLGLTRAQWQEDPRQASPQALQFRTRKSTEQQQLGAQLAGDIAPNWSYQAAAWGGRRSVTQFQAIPVAVQAPPNHPGGVIDFDRTYGGVDARVQLALDALTLTLGANVERLDEDRRGYENFTLQPALTLGTLGRLRRDESNIVESRDVYAQVESGIGPGWKLHAGVRASQVEFRGDDRFLANGDDSGSARYDSVNPTVGIVYRPSQSSSVYASYGRGFETPTLNELAYRPDGSAGFNTALEPARSNNYEIGAKAAASKTLRGTIAAFFVDTENDIVVRTNAGGRSTFANAAATRRRGVEASVGWEPHSSLSLYASVAAIRAEFAEPFFTCTAAPCTQPTVLVPAGNRLPGIPAYTSFIEAVYRVHETDITLDWRAQSKISVDDRNTDHASGYVSWAESDRFASATTMHLHTGNLVMQLVLLALLFNGATLIQLPGLITGTVVDPVGSGRPECHGASRDIRAHGRRSPDGQPGQFQLTFEASGPLRMVVTAAGFAEAIAAVSLDSRHVQITLKPAPFFEAVNVTSSRTDLPRADPAVTMTVLPAVELLTSAALTLDDALKMVPSFTLFRRTITRVSNPTAQGVTLRGLGGTGASRSLVLTDGVPFNGAFGGWVYGTNCRRWRSIASKCCGAAEAICMAQTPLAVSCRS